MANSTVNDAVTAALKDLGVLAEGEVPTAAQSSDGLDAFNRLVDQWAIERLMIYGIVQTQFSLTSGKQKYTIGIGGDVSIPRPVYIEKVNFQDTALSPPLEYQPTKLTDEAWQKVPIKGLTAVLPSAWFYDFANPLGGLFWWPIPTSSTLQGEIYVATPVPQFTAITSTIALPPGWWRAIVKNLAIEMAPMFQVQVETTWGGQPLLLIKQAAEAKTALKVSNKRLMDMAVDAGALIQGRWPWYDIRVGP